MNYIKEIDHYSEQIHICLHQKYLTNKQYLLCSQSTITKQRRLRIMTFDNGMLQMYSTEMITNEKDEIIDVRICLLNQICLVNALCIQFIDMDFMIKTIQGNIAFSLFNEEDVQILLNYLYLCCVFMNAKEYPIQSFDSVEINFNDNQNNLNNFNQ